MRCGVEARDADLPFKGNFNILPPIPSTHTSHTTGKDSTIHQNSINMGCYKAKMDAVTQYTIPQLSISLERLETINHDLASDPKALDELILLTRNSSAS